MRGFYFLVLLFSVKSFADDISNYCYYQKLQAFPNAKEIGAIYIKVDDPCIIVENKENASKKRYCQMFPSQLNLENDYPTIYPTEINFDGANLFFYVAGPWSEQKCSIDLPNEEIKCSPTGN